MKRGKRLKDLPSNQGQEPDLPKPATEWSRFRCQKATVEEDGADQRRGKVVVIASDRKGCSDLYGAILRKPDLIIQTTDKTRQEFGTITRLVITAGKKPDTIHAVATIRTSPQVEDLVSRAITIESRQLDAPLEPSEEASA